MTDGPRPAETPLISNPQEEQLEDRLALCMSGGGYRAMLFHLGVLWYLNDAGYLRRLARISSVSGGSLTSGVLALNWTKLNIAAAFEPNVVGPVRKMACTTIDVKSILGGIFGRGSVSDRTINRYRDILFGDRTLQDFPDEPRFVINATNVQTGSLFRFSKPYIGDWQLGRHLNPTKSVAETPTRLAAMPDELQERLINFGYGMAERAIRSFFDPNAFAAPRFPYARGIG